MPELVTSLVAAYRGKADLAIGNVYGSNLLNPLIILGICGLASGQSGLGVDPILITRDFQAMVATTFACLPIFWSGGVITRAEGWMLLGLNGLYIIEQILSNSASSATSEIRLIALIAIVALVLVLSLRVAYNGVFSAINQHSTKRLRFQVTSPGTAIKPSAATPAKAQSSSLLLVSPETPTAAITTPATESTSTPPAAGTSLPSKTEAKLDTNAGICSAILANSREP
jgi:hypothetical protein